MGSDSASSDEYRFAVAIHEAGHAIVAAYVGFDVLELRLEPKGGGQTFGRDFAGERVDYLAQWFAGDAAVSAICGTYRLPADTNPNSDQEMLRRDIRVLAATVLEQRRAKTRARQIVRGQRIQIIAIARALLATRNGRLAGKVLEKLLTPVWNAR